MTILHIRNKQYLLHTMTSQSDILLNETALFWVKMDELRRVLAQQDIFNTRNDAAHELRPVV
jgi:hypothetical protein